MLCYLTLVVQAAVLDGLAFDASPFCQDGFATAKIDVGRRQVADALVVAMVVVGVQSRHLVDWVEDESIWL